MLRDAQRTCTCRSESSCVDLLGGAHQKRSHEQESSCVDLLGGAHQKRSHEQKPSRHKQRVDHKAKAKSTPQATGLLRKSTCIRAPPIEAGQKKLAANGHAKAVSSASRTRRPVWAQGIKSGEKRPAPSRSSDIKWGSYERLCVFPVRLSLALFIPHWEKKESLCIHMYMCICLHVYTYEHI